MAIFDHYEFYKELYFKENERRTEIENSLNIPLAIITALVAGMYVLATTYPREADIIDVKVVFDGLFWIWLAAAFLALAFSVYFLILAFCDATNIFQIFSPSNRFSYRGIPYPQGLFNWYQNLDVYYQQNFPNNPNLADLADNDLKTYVLNQFVISADHNTFVNDRKLSVIFWCKRFLIASLICNVFALFPYMYVFSKKLDEVHKVELKNKSHKIEVQVQDSQNPATGMKKSGAVGEKTSGDSAEGFWSWIFPGKSGAVKNKESAVAGRSFTVHKDSTVTRAKEANRSTKSAQADQYLPVNKKPLEFDSSGKPCPPTGRIMIEGEYPEEPLNYKPAHKED